MTQTDTTQGRWFGWRNILRALGYLRRYWHLQLVALVCAIIAAFLGLVQPWVQKLFIDDVIPSRDAGMLVNVCLLLVGSILGGTLFSTLRGYLFTRVGERAVIDMRHELFRHFQQLSLSFFNREKTGRLMSVFTNDVPAMQGLYTSTLTDFITDTLRFAVTLGVMLAIDWQLTLLALPVLPLFGIALNGTSSVLYGTIGDFVDGARQSRAYGLFYTLGIGAGALSPVIFGVVSDLWSVSAALATVAASVLAILPMCQVLRPSLAAATVGPN